MRRLKPDSAKETFTYDAVGNRLTSAGIEGSWNYNQNNELLSYGLLAFEYDENGNLTGKSIGGQLAVKYIYDVENRLIQVKRADEVVIANYHYDPFGRRLWKEVGGVRTYFLYADEGLIGEYDAAGNAVRTYGYAPGSSWTTDPLYLKVGSQTYWYQNDHLGTPQKIIDTSGRVVWAATYDAFGQAQISLSEIENNLRFPGQYWDAETGLHYNWNRYYDPTTGRYLSTDPVHEGLNLYGYVFGNPNSFIDPQGLCAVRIVGGLTEIISGMAMISGSCLAGDCRRHCPYCERAG